MIPVQIYFHSASLVILTIYFGLLIVPLVNAVRPSSGCKSNTNSEFNKLDPGEWMDFTRTVPGTQTRTHRLTIPSNYAIDENLPSPMFLYFHGWGENHKSCGKRCQSDGADRGFISVAMTGYGPNNFNSWKHGGSSSPTDQWQKENLGPTCKKNTSDDYCNKYSNSGCNCSEADNCWWTTCFDSVQQTILILDEIEQNLCVDLDQIWAVGCSNGGMFTFELATDTRSASRIKGIIPIVGLPHYGYSTGPMVEGIRMMGMWGSKDTTVPPISNTNNPDKTLDTSSDGWYYTSSNRVMKDWTIGNGCTGDGKDPLGDMDWGISSSDKSFKCTLGCSEQNYNVVVGCIFDGGHVCNKNYIWEPIFNFMLDIATPSPTFAPTTEDRRCIENEGDIFLLKKKGNGNHVTRDCSWLASFASKKKRNNICNRKVSTKDDLSPAQDVCRITCNSCDTCYENKRTKFFRKIKANGKPIFKTCDWLNKKTNKEDICKESTDSYRGYGPPRDTCVITCSVGSCAM